MLPFPGFNLRVGILAALAGMYRIHGFWLPVAFSLVGSAVILLQPAIQRRLLGPSASLLLLSGMCLAWFWSAVVTQEIHYGDRAASVFTVLVIVFAISAALVVRSVRPEDSKLAKRLGLMIALCCLIGFVSSSAGGSGWMRALAASLGLSPQDASTAVIAFRKTVHFTFYGTFAVTAFATSLSANASLRRAVVSGLTLAIALACFDEGRQLRAVGRSGSPWDVLLDTTGAIVFLTFALRFAKSRSAKS